MQRSTFRTVLRLLLVVYVAVIVVLLVANVPPIGQMLLTAQDTLPGLRVLLGVTGAIAAVAFFVLMGYCLYHWGTRMARGSEKMRWFLVLILLNFVGVVIYYLMVIERQHDALKQEPASL